MLIYCGWFGPCGEHVCKNWADLLSCPAEHHKWSFSNRQIPRSAWLEKHQVCFHHCWTVAMMTMRPGISWHVVIATAVIWEWMKTFFFFPLSPSSWFLTLSMWFEAYCTLHMQYGKCFWVLCLESNLSAQY